MADWKRWCHWLKVVFLLVLVTSSGVVGGLTQTTLRCKRVLEDYGISQAVLDAVPSSAAPVIACSKVSDDHDVSCCPMTAQKEFRATAVSRLANTLTSVGQYARDLLNASRNTYEEHFQSKIWATRNHTLMSLTAYFGLPSSEVIIHIDTLFDSFRQLLFSERSVTNEQITTDITSSLSRFFSALLPSILKRVLAGTNDNSDALRVMDRYSSSFHRCLSEAGSELSASQFGDGPTELAIPLARTITIIRLLLDTLRTGQTALQNVSRDAEAVFDQNTCAESLTPQRMCPACSAGMLPSQTSLCSGYCSDSVRPCLRPWIGLSPHWDGLIEGFAFFSQRAVVGYGNLDRTLASLSIGMSELVNATMEKGKQFQTSLINKCGNPRFEFVPQKIADDSEPGESELQQQSVIFESGRPSTESLTKKVKLVNVALRQTKGFFKLLVESVCSDRGYTNSYQPTNRQCWNGVTVGSYKPSSDGRNPYWRRGLGPSHPLVQKISDRLAEATEKLMSPQSLEFASGPMPPRRRQISFRDELYQDLGSAGDFFSYSDDEDLFYSGSGDGGDNILTITMMPPAERFGDLTPTRRLTPPSQLATQLFFSRDLVVLTAVLSVAVSLWRTSLL